MSSRTSTRRRTVGSVFQSRPSIAIERTFWAGDSCTGAIIRVGLLLQVEIVHPTSGKNYARMCRNMDELKAAKEHAMTHCLALGMELTEVVK